MVRVNHSESMAMWVVTIVRSGEEGLELDGDGGSDGEVFGGGVVGEEVVCGEGGL